MAPATHTFRFARQIPVATTAHRRRCRLRVKRRACCMGPGMAAQGRRRASVLLRSSQWHGDRHQNDRPRRPAAHSTILDRLHGRGLDALCSPGRCPCMLGLMGAILLTGATLPQAARLVRSRSARDFSWGFIMLSLTGCLLLCWHAIRLDDTAFALVNGSGVAFWCLVAAMRWAGRSPQDRTARSQHENRRGTAYIPFQRVSRHEQRPDSTGARPAQNERRGPSGPAGTPPHARRHLHRLPGP